MDDTMPDDIARELATIDHRGPYIRLADGRIDCEIRLKPPHPYAGEEWLPFTADANDTPLCRAVHYHASRNEMLMDPPAPDPDQVREDMAVAARARRDGLLAASDWTQLPDIPTGTKKIWAAYRQALRDVPERDTFPAQIVWPVAPA